VLLRSSYSGSDTRLSGREGSSLVAPVALRLFKRFIYIYFSWYDKSTKLTANEKETEALVSVRQFYAFIINGVSHRKMSKQFTINMHAYLYILVLLDYDNIVINICVFSTG
jgi:hypothetical protein